MYSANKNRPSLIHSVNQQTFVEDSQRARHCLEFFWRTKENKTYGKKSPSSCLDKMYIYENHKQF